MSIEETSKENLTPEDAQDLSTKDSAANGEDCDKENAIEMTSPAERSDDVTSVVESDEKAEVIDEGDGKAIDESEEATSEVPLEESDDATDGGVTDSDAVPEKKISEDEQESSTESEEADYQDELTAGTQPKATKKRGPLIVVVAALVLVGFLFGTHIICFHHWVDATCEDPRMCTICGKTEGKALGHKWVDATCTAPKTCSVCGKTETFGEPLGHKIEGQSCTTDGKCTRCGEVFPATGHTWVDATCTTPKTCSTCGATEGDALGHTTDNGVCERCGQEFYSTRYGSGDDVISDVSVGDSVHRAHFTNNGSSNFAVIVYDGNGKKDLLVNEIGSYDGYVLLPMASPLTFEITSSGDWSYTIESLPDAPETSLSGTGDYVSGYIKLKTGTWQFKHDGSSNFAVRVYTVDGVDLLVNTIGSYDGKRRVSLSSESYGFFEIMADGNWSITPAE